MVQGVLTYVSCFHQSTTAAITILMQEDVLFVFLMYSCNQWNIRSIILSTLGPLRLHLSVIRNILLLFNDWFGCHICFFVLWCCAWLLFISMSCLSIFFNAVFGLCSFWSCFGNSSFYCRVRLLFFFMSCLDIVLFVVPL
jgi:hypothetical protein